MQKFTKKLSMDLKEIIFDIKKTYDKIDRNKKSITIREHENTKTNDGIYQKLINDR